MIGVRVIEFESQEYWAAIELRLEILRRPLGLDFSPEQLKGEVNDIHLAIFDESEMVGTLTLSPAGQSIRMRQVAVVPHRQGQGHGRELVKFAEVVAAAQGYEWMTLHARASAVDFYTHLGYDLVGEPFVEVSIPHRAMQKHLSRNAADV